MIKWFIVKGVCVFSVCTAVNLGYNMGVFIVYSEDTMAHIYRYYENFNYQSAYLERLLFYATLSAYKV